MKWLALLMKLRSSVLLLFTFALDLIITLRPCIWRQDGMKPFCPQYQFNEQNNSLDQYIPYIRGNKHGFRLVEGRFLELREG